MILLICCGFLVNFSISVTRYDAGDPCINILGMCDDYTHCGDCNRRDYDGCSSDCVVERGFHCLQQVIPEFRFDCGHSCGDGIPSPEVEECDDGNNTEGDGCTPDCKIEEDYKCEGEPSVCTKYIPKPPPSFSEIIEKSLLEPSIILSVGLIIPSSIFLGIPTQFFWSLLNHLQLMHLLSLMAFYYPQNILNTFRKLRMTNFESIGLNSTGLMFTDIKDLTVKEPIDYLFENHEYYNSSILINCSEAFVLFFIFIAFFIIIYLLYSFCWCVCPKTEEERNKSCCLNYLFQLINIQKERICLASIFRIIHQSYLKVIFSIWLNLKFLSVKTSADMLSIYISSFLLFVYLGYTLTVVIICFRKIVRHDNAVVDQESNPHKISVIDMLEKDYNRYKRYYPFIHVIHLLYRLCFVLILFSFRQSPSFQIFCIMVMSFVRVLFLCYFRPYLVNIDSNHEVDKSLNIQEIINECICFLISFCFFFFNDKKYEFATEGRNYTIGSGCIALMFFPIVFYLCLMVIQIIIFLRKKCTVTEKVIPVNFPPQRNIDIHNMHSTSIISHNTFSLTKNNTREKKNLFEEAPHEAKKPKLSINKHLAQRLQTPLEIEQNSEEIKDDLKI
ncbi:unnamed protein product [Moneuplotes crassus]|uniref:Uncharacterized protein n=1 Tax=Euplotes crassus TaxID=5936 RepID=A0AAD1Y9T3_EUPCR|nr:unnamed protein product [Moneuplotes crassus]